MILVDTSVWIDFFSSKPLCHVDLLKKLILNDEDICLCGIVLTEVLQGIKDEKEFQKTKLFFESLIFLPIQYHTFIKSAQLYRSLRKKGVTIKRVMDCLIATVAMENNIFVLHNDKDFSLIESKTQLKIYQFKK